MSALIVIPAYTAINWRLMQVIMQSRIPLLPLYEMSDLPRTRSLLLTMACKQEAVERILMIDSDIVPSVDQLKELATSPLVTEKQALTGMYALRGGTHRLSVHAPNAPKDATEFQAEWSGLGFAAVSKKSLMKLVKSLKPIKGDDLSWTPFCVPLITPRNEYLSDDRVLWSRLAKAGVKLMASRKLHVGHIDPTVQY